jgi:lysophospholipase L1-like esterase
LSVYTLRWLWGKEDSVDRGRELIDHRGSGQQPMNYQKVVCWGDSQSFGARTYGCYPLYLAKSLNASTRYVRQILNFSSNGHTVRDLWFRISHEILTLSDVYQACILIGTNDVGNNSPPDVFEEYYRQVLNSLQVNRFKAVYCGEIPPIWPDGNVFFSTSTQSSRDEYNRIVRRVVGECKIATLVEFADLSAECYSDPVHLNEAGNMEVARSYAQAIRAR